MAIYTGGMRMQDEAKFAAKRIAEQQAKAEAGEAKRKGRAGIFGKIAGMGLGALGGMALTGLTGGALNPMTMKLLQAGVKGGSSWLGRKLADDATKQGIFKTPGQVSKIEAGGKYGYGRGEAKSLTEALIESRRGKEDWGTLAGDIGGSFMADVGGEKLDEFTGGKLKDLLGKGADPTMDYKSTGMKPSEYDAMVKSAQEGYHGLDDAGELLGEGDFWDSSNLSDDVYDQFGKVDNTAVSEEIFAQGGQVPQQQLMLLLALAQMQQQEEQTAYSGTPLEEIGQPTIAEYFESQGKTLGGNNTQSLSQILGR